MNQSSSLLFFVLLLCCSCSVLARLTGNVIDLHSRALSLNISNNKVEQKLAVNVYGHSVNISLHHHQHHRFSASPDYCITTLLTSRRHVEAANVLVFSIRRHLKPEILTKTVFVAMLVEGKNNTNAEIAQQLHGWDVVVVPYVQIPNAQKFNARIRDQYAKLDIWSWIRFKRVLFVDVSCLAVGDMSGFLNKTKSEIAAVREYVPHSVLSKTVASSSTAATATAPTVPEFFNLAVFSVKPDRRGFDRLMAMCHNHTDYDMNTGDYGFINMAMHGKFDEWPVEFNADLAIALDNRTYWQQVRPKLRIIHYTTIRPFEEGMSHHKHYNDLEEELSLWTMERKTYYDTQYAETSYSKLMYLDSRFIVVLICLILIPITVMYCGKSRTRFNCCGSGRGGKQ